MNARLEVSLHAVLQPCVSDLDPRPASSTDCATKRRRPYIKMLTHSRRSSTSSISLQELASHSSYPNLRPPRSPGQNGDQSSIVSESPIEGPRRQPTNKSSGSQQETRGLRRIVPGLVDFWVTQVSCEVEFSACRDHLGKDTFLLFR